MAEMNTIICGHRS